MVKDLSNLPLFIIHICIFSLFGIGRILGRILLCIMEVVIVSSKEKTGLTILAVITIVGIVIIIVGTMKILGTVVRDPKVSVSADTVENASTMEYDFTILSSSISQALSKAGVDIGTESTEGSFECSNMTPGEVYALTLSVDVVNEDTSKTVTLSQTKTVSAEGESFIVNYNVTLPRGLELENLRVVAELETEK